MIWDYTSYPGKELKPKKEYLNHENAVISIITPYYNSKKYIEMTANSVLNQTYPYFEWIIVDDGSNDKESLAELEKIEKMDHRIKVFHKENEGLAVTRDFGASKANNTSKYFVFLDDDDVIDSTFLECAYWTLETNSDASWAYTDVVNFGGEEYLWRKMFNLDVEKKENLLTAMAMIRKVDFFEIGGYELREKAVFEDWNLWLKLLAKGKYPVRMNFLGFWYRRKPKAESELNKAKNNSKNAMKYVDETAKKIKKDVQAIQYPKQDYNWEEIPDMVPQIIIPKIKKNEKIKILMIIPWMVVGGADKFNLDIISKFNKDKFEFIVISTIPSENILRQRFEEYATIYDLTTFLDRRYWVSFINYIIEKDNIDLIFNTNSTFGYACIPCLKVNYPEIPIVDYVHMEEWYWRNGGYLRDSSMISGFIDKTYVCNKNTERIFIEHFGNEKEQVGTCYIGVDEKRFDPKKYNKEELLNKYKIPTEGKYIISYICRISSQKRPYLMLEIIKKLKEKRNDFLVLVAGDGPMLDEMKKKANLLNLNNNILFLGSVSSTEEIYSISDLTINCSIKEGLALTTYESLAMAVPVVSADVGGQKELINDEVGIIVPCLQEETEINNFEYSEEEVNNYVSGIDEVLNNLNKFKSKCRERVLKGFTIDNMIKNMEEAFYHIIKNPNKEKIDKATKCDRKIVKELITEYLIAFKDEYNWFCDEFNKNNIDMYNVSKDKKSNYLYKYTLEYKIKHAIIIILRKIGIYSFYEKLRGRK